MKKFLFSIFLGALCMAQTFAQSNSKIAVVYFSCTGNTERLANTTAKALNADILQIEPVKAYTSADLNWHDKSSRSTIECNDAKSRPAIKNIDVSKYDTIIVAYPIWWYDAPKAVYTFVDNANLTGKTIVPICTSGGSGIGKSGTNLEKSCGKGNWKNGKLFNSRTSEKEIKDFFDKVL